MSKEKQNKKNQDNQNNSNNGHEAEVKAVHENALEKEHFPPVSETVKVTIETAEKTPEIPKVEIINLKEQVITDSPKEEKEKTKISIMDLTQNKQEKTKKSRLNLKADFNSEKLLDALVMVGGGVIAATGFTSRTIASIGSNLIRK